MEEPYELSGRLVLALACLDLLDFESARHALEPAVAGWSLNAPQPLALGSDQGEPFAVQSDPLADLAENELERAFDHAEAEPAEVWTTNRVAEAALRAIERGEPEGVRLDEPDSPFATETVAHLLESQGDSGRARAIRRALTGEVAEAELSPGERKRWVATLERWLDNLRRASQ